MRESAASVVVTFITTYPLGAKRVTAHMKQMISNCSYVYEDGRQSSFEALATLVRLLPLPLLEDHAASVFLPMTLRLVSYQFHVILCACLGLISCLFHTILSRLFPVIFTLVILRLSSSPLKPRILVYTLLFPPLYSSSFPFPPLRSNQLPLFITTVCHGQVNDPSPVCREAAADVIASLARRVSPDTVNTLIQYSMRWLSSSSNESCGDMDASTRAIVRTGSQVAGLMVATRPDLFRKLGFVLQSVASARAVLITLLRVMKGGVEGGTKRGSLEKREISKEDEGKGDGGGGISWNQ